jgi:FkbM family methyltransferase
MPKSRRGSPWFKRLRKVHPVSPQSHGFYTVPESCQVPFLPYLYEIFLGRRADGFFVEVGANDGVTVSNTWGLAALGWGGHLLEPVPEAFELCVANHRDHTAVTVHQLAISSAGRDSIEVLSGGLLSTVEGDQWDEYRALDWISAQSPKRLESACTSLDAFLRGNSVNPEFELLVVDVEGHEWAVFEGFSLEHWRPKMMIVEVADCHPYLGAARSRDARLSRDIQRQGYVIVYKDAINVVFVRQDLWELAMGIEAGT